MMSQLYHQKRFPDNPTSIQLRRRRSEETRNYQCTRLWEERVWTAMVLMRAEWDYVIKIISSSFLIFSSNAADKKTFYYDMMRWWWLIVNRLWWSWKWRLESRNVWLLRVLMMIMITTMIPFGWDNDDEVDQLRHQRVEMPFFIALVFSLFIQMKKKLNSQRVLRVN